MGGRSGQSIGGGFNDPGKGFVYSNSFTNDRGNVVDRYSIGGGGYASVEKYKDGYVVTNVTIWHENQGKGFATKLYKSVNKESVKATGKTLQSIKADKQGNIELSNEGRALWKSLVRKGLAKEIENGRYRFIK